MTCGCPGFNECELAGGRRTKFCTVPFSPAPLRGRDDGWSWREWTAVMVGDAVRVAGQEWLVTRVQDGWVELRAGGRVEAGQVLAQERIEMREGPGWGPAGDTDQAGSWAERVISQVLGGRVVLA